MGIRLLFFGTRSKPCQPPLPSLTAFVRDEGLPERSLCDRFAARGGGKRHHRPLPTRILIKPGDDRVSPRSRKQSSESHPPEHPQSPFRSPCASWARSNPYAENPMPTCNCSTRRTYMFLDQRDRLGKSPRAVAACSHWA